MVKLLTLPTEILLLIFYELIPEDIARLSSTNRLFYAIANDRSVWSQRVHRIQSRLPFLFRDRPRLLSSSIDTLKQECRRQSRLDSLWSKYNPSAGRVTEVDFNDYSARISFFAFFPGGEWLVMVLQDGQFCLKEVDRPGGGTPPRSVTAYFDPQVVRNVLHNFWTYRAADGSAILSTSQIHSTDQSCLHFYHVSPLTLSIVYLGKKLMPHCCWASPIRYYPEDENMLACLHRGNAPQNMQLSVFLLTPPSDEPFGCETQAVFDLGDFVPFSSVDEDLFSICLPYSHLLIVTHGSCSIRIYEISPLDTLGVHNSTTPIRVPIIWEWSTVYQQPNDFEPTLLFPRIPCHRVLQDSSQRVIYIIAEDSLTVHRLFLSVSRQSDQHHPYHTTFKHHIQTRSRTFINGNPYLSLESHRGAWLNNDSLGYLTFETVSLQDDVRQGGDSGDTDNFSLPVGSFRVQMRCVEPHLRDWDFDEVSGRFCLYLASFTEQGAVLESIWLVDRASM